MHVYARCRSAVAAALLLLAASPVIVSPAAAQQPPTLSATPTGPYGMSMAEWQGFSCLWGGSLGALGVFYYNDVLAVTATGVANPLLPVPLVATGFLGGCSVGANGSPGLKLAAAPIRAISGRPSVAFGPALGLISDDRHDKAA